MPIIKAQAGVVTEINVFTVPRGSQDALVQLLAEAAQAVSDTPGWLSASLHRSLDGTRVVNYAQCDSEAAQAEVFRRLQTGGWLERNSRLGTAHPGLYEVAWTLER